MQDARDNLCDTCQLGLRSPEKSLHLIENIWIQVKLPSTHPLSTIPLQDLMLQAAFLLHSLLFFLMAILFNPSNKPVTADIFTPQANLQVLVVAFGVISFVPEHLELSNSAALHQLLVASTLYIKFTETDAPVNDAEFKNWSRELQGAMLIAYPDVKLVWRVKFLLNQQLLIKARASP